MKTKIYAAYGSNMNISQMAKRCPAANVIGTGTLRDYRLTFRGMNDGVANIEIKQGYFVPIVLWEITDSCEKALDIYEGYPSFYTKKDIEVTMADGKAVTAMAYVMTKKYECRPAVPSDKYLETIHTGYLDNDLSFKVLRNAVNENYDEVIEFENKNVVKN